MLLPLLLAADAAAALPATVPSQGAPAGLAQEAVVQEEAAQQAAQPYAYTVDYRPLDACAPPACRLAGEKLVGWWDEVQSDGGRGAYARIGEPRTELYFRRSRVLRATPAR